MHRMIWYILKRLKKDNIALTSWYSIILPTVFSIIIGIAIKLLLIYFKSYDLNLKYTAVPSSVVAVYCAVLFPSGWHTSIISKYRDALKQKEITQG